jgi:hypothetical protein
MATDRVVQSPGEPAKRCGLWKPIRGGYEVTVQRGKTLPPTPLGGDWILVDPTDNASDVQ